MKSKVDKLDVDKLLPVPVDSSKISDVVKDAYNAKIKNIEDKIPDITDLATNTTLNAKINEVKKKVPNITNLAAPVATTTVENKMSNVSDLVRKADYGAKISEMENKYKYFTTSDYNKLTCNILDTKITQLKLVNESGLNEKIETLATKEKMKTLAKKTELKAKQDKIVKAQTYDLSIFIDQSYFNNDGAQIYLAFQQIYKTITTFSGIKDIISE